MLLKIGGHDEGQKPSFLYHLMLIGKQSFRDDGYVVRIFDHYS